MVKSWKIVLATLLLTALYVVSVQRALGGRRHLYRVEPEMVAPAEGPGGSGVGCQRQNW